MKFRKGVLLPLFPRLSNSFQPPLHLLTTPCDNQSAPVVIHYFYSFNIELLNNSIKTINYIIYINMKYFVNRFTNNLSDKEKIKMKTMIEHGVICGKDYLLKTI